MCKIISINKHQEGIYLKPYKLKQLAAMYGVCRQTFAAWLKPFKKDIGIKKGQYFSTTQVEIIFEKLVPPFEIYKNEWRQAA